MSDKTLEIFTERARQRARADSERLNSELWRALKVLSLDGLIVELGEKPQPIHRSLSYVLWDIQQSVRALLEGRYIVEYQRAMAEQAIAAAERPAGTKPARGGK